MQSPISTIRMAITTWVSLPAGTTDPAASFDPPTWGCTPETEEEDPEALVDGAVVVVTDADWLDRALEPTSEELPSLVEPTEATSTLFAFDVLPKLLVTPLPPLVAPVAPVPVDPVPVAPVLDPVVEPLVVVVVAAMVVVVVVVGVELTVVVVVGVVVGVVGVVVVVVVVGSGPPDDHVPNPATADHVNPFGSLPLAVKVTSVFQKSEIAPAELAQAMPVSQMPLSLAL